MMFRSHGKHRGRRRIEELSNSFALMVVMLPVILGAFGMGIDMARNTYIRTSLQNTLDMATVAGAAVTNVTAGQPTINPTGAIQQTERIYAIDRNTGPGLACIGSRAIVSGTTLPMCWKRWHAPRVRATKLTYSVVEKSRNAFLPVIGIDFQTYHLVSHAVVNQQTQ